MDNDIQQPQDFNNIAPPEAPQPGQQFKPDVPAQKPKKSKKKIVLITLLILLLAGGAAAAYFMYFKKDTQTTSTEQSTQQPETKQPGPVSLIYSENSKVTQLKITDKATSEALTIPNSGYPLETDTHKEKSVFIVPSAYQGKDAVYYSNDNGQSFTKIYEGKAPVATDQLGEQITDVIFSNDGSSVLIGVLNQPGNGNTLTQISLDGTYQPNQLMTIETAGAFFYGYDDESQKVVLREGCYNCGGGYPTEVSVYDVKSKQKGTVIKSDKPIISFSINNDFTEALYVTGVPKEDIGGIFATGPYEATMLSNPTDSASIKTTTLPPKGGAEVLSVVTGFTNDSQVPYASFGTKLYTYKDGKEQEFYTPSKPIQDVYYIDNKQVISKNGEGDAFTVNHFVLEGTQNNSLLEGTQITYVIGTTYN